MKARVATLIAVVVMATGCASRPQHETAYAQKSNARLAQYAAAGRFSTFPKAKKGEKVVPPRIISAPHPSGERQRGDFPAGGEVLVVFVVGIDGKVEEAIAANLPINAYTVRAVNAVKRWTFVPAMVEDQPRKALLAVPIRFELR